MNYETYLLAIIKEITKFMYNTLKKLHSYIKLHSKITYSFYITLYTIYLLRFNVQLPVILSNLMLFQ